MAFWTPIVALLAGAYVALRAEKKRETRVVRSIRIRTTPSLVFDVVGHVDRVPEWYRQSRWLPRALAPASLARWGEHIPSSWRLENCSSTPASNEIQIRWARNREFGYRYESRTGVSYESLFRISSKDRECTLTWDLRYRTHRWLDALYNRAVTEKRTSETMGASLHTIRRLAESTAAPKSWQRRLVEVPQTFAERSSIAG
jgi:hypothetical protein